MDLIPVIKVWNDRDGNYGQKDIFINPANPFDYLEDCILKKGNEKLECTKIFYPDKFITILGSVQCFFETCRQANVSMCILNDLYKEGITIKQFIQQNERLNGIEL